MSVGTLTGRVVLEKPGRLYCGDTEPVKGTVHVRYEPSQKQPEDAELFGPVTVSVTVHGRMKTKLKPDKETFRARIPIFGKRMQVYDGPIRITKGETLYFPFQFSFPERIQNPSTIRTFKQEAGYNMDPDQALPPTMSFAHAGFSSSGEALVEYKASANMSMRGIDVAVQAGEGHETMIRYERPRVTTPVQPRPQFHRGTIAFKDKCLIPEEDRPNPQGFKEKAASMFQVTHRPFCSFKWSMSSPQQIHRNEPLMLRLRIEPQLEQFTAPIVPEVKVQMVEVHIIAYLLARGQVHVFTEPSFSGEELAMARTVRSPDDAPFKEENDWTRVLAINSVTNLPSSFRTVCIQQTYRMKIKVTVSIAGRHEVLKGCTFLTIHPPLVEDDPTGEQGPDEITPVVPSEDVDPSLPPYEPKESPPPFTPKPESYKVSEAQ